MSEFNEIDFVEGFKKSFGKKPPLTPTFFKKVIDHYDLWLFSDDTLRTLKKLIRNYDLYINVINKVGEENLFSLNFIEEVRNVIEKMSPVNIFYSEVFGLADFRKHQSFFILYGAIKFLLNFRSYYLHRKQKEREFDLISKDISDLKKGFFLYEKKVPSPFDSLTDEESNEIRDFVWHYFV